MMTLTSPRTATLLLLAALTLFGCGEDDPKPVVNPPPNNNNMNPPSAAIVVSAQRVEDTRKVVVDRVVADVNGWVAIHTANAGGDRDVLLGVVAVTPGEREQLEVTLDRDVTHRANLLATLYVETSNNNMFDPMGEAADVPAVNSNNVQISRPFSVTFDPRIEVEDQRLSASDRVTVKQATSRGAGWVVIRARRNNMPAEVLGAAPVINGSHNSGISVELDRELSDGERLFASLHTDSPADAMFTFTPQGSEDGPALDDSMQPVIAPFTVEVVELRPSLVARDQAPRPFDEVVIASVVAPGPSWLVVQEFGAVGEPGEVIGRVSLDAGEHDDVRVKLDRDIIDGGLLSVTLHVDAGQVGALELPEPDAPYLDNSGQLLRTFITTVVDATQPSISALDQQVNPLNRVIVRNVIAAQPGFVVIYEPDDEAFNGLGARLGVAPVGFSLSSEVAVELNRDVRDGEQLLAVLHLDRGMPGVFEYPGPDDLVRDATGPVSALFRVSVPSMGVTAISARDQDANPLNTVRIAQVVYDSAGWVVVQADNSGQPGAVLGHAAVSAGVRPDVAVTLSRDVVNGERLWATLHVDAGTMGTFEFPGVDMPAVAAGGQPARSSFVISLRDNVVEALSQSPGEVTTLILVERVFARQDAFVVARLADMNGEPGEILGAMLVSAGLHESFELPTERPMRDGDEIILTLHADSPADGQFTHRANAAQDPPLNTLSGMPARSGIFTMLLNDSIPAVIFTINAVGSSAYQWISARPSIYQSMISSTSANNPTITLRRGWRYQIVNNNQSAHPIEFIRRGATRAQDQLLLSPSGGSLSSDPDIDWTAIDDVSTFTVTGDLASGAASLDGYRCGVPAHEQMRGQIVLTD
jgi:hypothetical protein